jgi:hypothetical protein
LTRLFLIALAATRAFGAGTAEISVEIRADRHVIVHEHYSAAPSELIYLASPCARMELTPAGPGSWVTVPISGSDLTYEVAPVSARPRSCGIPLLMPKSALDSVSVTVEDRGSGVSGISMPHLVRSADRWTATFPAIPSKIQIEWPDGNAPQSKTPPLATGWFYPNFWGLVAILVTWTIAYLIWARQ